MLNLYTKPISQITPEMKMKALKMNPQRLGVIARQKVAHDLEKRLLVFIKESPGLSVYDLSKKARRDPSTIHSAVKRLDADKNVTTRTILRKEGKIKRVYPLNFKFEDSCEITLPKDVVHVENPTWQQAYVYPLSAESIGISGEPVPDWQERANPIVQKAERERDGSIRVRLPDKICDFYELSKKETLLAYINNKALLTITGTFQ